ncbi:MAG: CBS domain-containing protein [Planctomycetales bacterium]|nr:CBS domain-containing protein [Planctomycetales bacterium]
MNVTVQDVMQTDVETIGPRQSLAELQNALLKADVGALPVVSSGQLVGIASRSDVVKRLQSERVKAMRNIGLPQGAYLSSEDAIDLGDVIGEQLEKIRVEQVMQSEVISVEPNDSVQVAAELLAANHIHRLPVVDNGHLVGVISSHDIIGLIANKTFVPADR